MAGIKVQNNVRVRNSLGQFASDFEIGLEAAMQVVAVELTAAGKAYAPVDRGILKGRTSAEAHGKTAILRSNVYYAGYVHEGTPAHEIGEEGQVLSNPRERFFAKGPVQHPGTRANPYLRNAFNSVWPNVLDIIDAHV